MQAVIFFLALFASVAITYTPGYSFSVTSLGNVLQYTSIAIGNTQTVTDVTVGIYRTSTTDGVLFYPLNAIAANPFSPTGGLVSFGVFFELAVFVEFQFDNTTLTLTATNAWRAQFPAGGLTTIQPSSQSAYLAFSNAFTNSALSFNATTQGGSCSGNYYEHTVQQSLNGSVPYWTADIYNGASTLSYNASFGITKVDSKTVVIDSLATNMGSSPSAVILDANNSLTLCGIDTFANGSYVSNGPNNCVPFNQTSAVDISCTDPGTAAGSQLLCSGNGIANTYLITFASNFAGCN
jgi:hypothetical protein